MIQRPELGRIIRAWRASIGLTQEALATVSRWENGRVRPSSLAWKALERLAADRGGPALLGHEPTELGMTHQVAAGVGARREDLQALLPGVHEDGVRQPSGEVSTAEGGRRPRVPHVQDIAAPLVHELGLEAVDTGKESSRLVLDLDVHRAQTDRSDREVKPPARPSGPARR